MAQLSNAFEDEILNYFVKMTGPTFTRTTLYLALSTAAAADAFTGNPLTGEVTGGGYARKPITFGTVSGGSVANSADIVFTATDGTWPANIVTACVCDHLTTGNVLFHTTITTVTIGNGDSLTFVATTGLVLSMQ